MNDFKIQIPQEIVRNKDITDKEFIVLAKLIQVYYSQSKSSRDLTFSINSDVFLHFCKLTEKRQLKDLLKLLYKKGLIQQEIDRISKGITITLSENIIPEFNEGMIFVQFESYVFNRNILDAVGHKGVRILYQIMSYINYKTGKDHCYASIERMCKDIGTCDKTYRNYLEKLEDVKFITVVRHKATPENYYDKNGVERNLLERWNNHYFINTDKIKKFSEKNKILVS